MWLGYGPLRLTTTLHLRLVFWHVESIQSEPVGLQDEVHHLSNYDLACGGEWGTCVGMHACAICACARVNGLRDA